MSYRESAEERQILARPWQFLFPDVSPSAPRRIATISVLTSPLAQPGTGAAGAVNVYVVETAR
jgi:hypothetical protein